MTADTNDCNGVLDGSNVEFDGKSGLNSSPCRDLSNATGDSNCIVSGKDGEVIVERKDDLYSSYVLVDGGSGDPVERDLNIADPKEDAEKKPIIGENTVLEPNASSPIEDLKVDSEELKEEKEENGECCEENCCDVDQSGVLADGLDGKLNIDEKVTNDEDEQKLEPSMEAEANTESEITATEAVESELHQLENGHETETSNASNEFPTRGAAGDLGVELDMNLETDMRCIDDSELQIQRSEVVVSEVASESGQPENRHETETSNAANEIPAGGPTGDLGMESDVNLELQVEESKAMVSEVESELHLLGNGKETEISNVANEIPMKGPTGDIEMEVEVNLESVTRFVDDSELKIQESQVVASEVESELHLLENGKEAETSNVANEIPMDGPSEDLEMEPHVMVETDTRPIDDSELEKEVRNGSADSSVLEKEVRDCADEGGELEVGEGAASVEGGELEVGDRAASVEGSSVETGVLTVSVESSKLETEVRNEPLESEEHSMPDCDVDVIKEEVEIRNGSIESSERTISCPVDDLRQDSGATNGSLESSQSEPACSVDETEQVPEVGNGPAENGKTVHTVKAYISNTSSETVVSNFSVGNCESSLSCPVDDKSEAEVRNGHAESDEGLPICSADDSKSETEDGNGFARSAENMPPCPVDEESEVQVRKDLLESTEDVPACHVGDRELKSEAMDSSAEIFESAPKCSQDVADVDSEDQSMNRDDGEKPISEVEDIKAIASNGEKAISEEVEDIKAIASNGEKAISEEVEDVEAIPSNESLPSSQEDSTAALEGPKVDAEVGKRLPIFMIRIPRYVDENISLQIDIAAREVDKRTQHRDSIKDARKLKKVTCNEYKEIFEAAKLEEKAARDAVTAKRREMDALQLMINRMKTATSIEEIDEKIHNMEHRIEHETVPLKEEKQLIREIKQLKQAREIKQLQVADMVQQAELQEAFNQRDSIEKRLKLMKQELDSLRSEVSRTECITKAAKQKFYDEYKSLDELQAKFKDADVLRQEAYDHLVELKKQLYEKNKYFRMYNEDKRTAWNYAHTGNRDALQSHCADQVERINELLKSNDEFRNDYVKNNMRSTLRRLSTLDGRSLGPDEKPPVLRVEERIDNATVLAASTSKTEQEKRGAPVVAPKADAKPAVDAGKNSTLKSKKSSKTIVAETGPVTGPSRVEMEEQEKERKRAKEEEEMARKAEELAKKEQELARKEEELRKEEAAARLKEQRRLEERAKAKEAEERKRRNAEKAQARAELKAQKEAELKEKRYINLFTLNRKERRRRGRRRGRRRLLRQMELAVALKGNPFPFLTVACLLKLLGNLKSKRS
ncbi:uncharacterized protein LOC131222322 isoform X2 [Magnolia sinica]|uniref:uncharacterized protein LOC131222322 isoform X2 n=1 Tax=Magnolia sinica TaxID=86752 RepID=UPI002659C099|nr:uncharacterized protein LOC131222322 isoform X2 [Magnolia sinica]